MTQAGGPDDTTAGGDEVRWDREQLLDPEAEPVPRLPGGYGVVEVDAVDLMEVGFDLVPVGVEDV